MSPFLLDDFFRILSYLFISYFDDNLRRKPSVGALADYITANFFWFFFLNIQMYPLLIFTKYIILTIWSGQLRSAVLINHNVTSSVTNDLSFANHEHDANQHQYPFQSQIEWLGEELYRSTSAQVGFDTVRANHHFLPRKFEVTRELPYSRLHIIDAKKNASGT